MKRENRITMCFAYDVLFTQVITPSFYEMHSNLLNDDTVHISNRQVFILGFKEQDMKSVFKPEEVLVLNNEMDSSSWGWNAKNMFKPYVCSICSKSFSQRNNLKKKTFDGFVMFIIKRLLERVILSVIN